MKRESWFGLAIIILFVVALLVNVKKKSFEKEFSGAGPALFQRDGIAVVELFGPIMFAQSPNYFGLMGADTVLKQLHDVQKNKHVKGLLIRVNSPGGTVGASQEIYRAIQQVKTELNVPVVAQIGDMGASGGYYAALGADTIFANPGSLVGSIGVIIGNYSIHELAQKHGVDFNVFKSGAYKDVLSMWRPSSEAEKKMLQGLVDDVYLQFQAAFMDSRKLSKAQAAKLAQGQIYTGKQALKHNIVDRLGGYKDALRYVGELTGLGADPHIISTKKHDWTSVVNMLNTRLNTRFPMGSAMPELR